MQDVFDIYTIIFLALAVFIFLRLRSVLGQRTGRERPPYDPYSAREPARPAAEKVVSAAQSRGRGRRAEGVRAQRAGRAGDALEGRCRAGFGGSPRGLDAIVAIDPDFDPKHFLTGARAAYEMIVTAFADGDRRTLKPLLSREVYDGFDSAITRPRRSAAKQLESKFVSIDKAEITGAEVRGTHRACHRALPVAADLSVTRDKDGNVIDGSAEKVTDVTDVWTFARDLSSRDPNWKLVATEAGQ